MYSIENTVFSLLVLVICTVMNYFHSGVISSLMKGLVTHTIQSDSSFYPVIDIDRVRIS